VAPDVTGANRRTRPLDRGTSGRRGEARETAGLLRKAPDSKTKTKAVAASATASDVGEHAALERHRKAGGLRVAQEE
jgi:hypothetical protein